MNLDTLKRSVSLVEAGLNKANMNGSFELGESFALKAAVDNLKQLVGDLERSQLEKAKKAQTTAKTTLPTVPEDDEE